MVSNSRLSDGDRKRSKPKDIPGQTQGEPRMQGDQLPLNPWGMYPNLPTGKGEVAPDVTQAATQRQGNMRNDSSHGMQMDPVSVFLHAIGGSGMPEMTPSMPAPGARPTSPTQNLQAPAPVANYTPPNPVEAFLNFLLSNGDPSDRM